MPLPPGTRWGPYEIVSAVGAGGMGEVYRARDTRLDRTVAIKISQEQFSERFQREAHAIAALNHPNICQLYDVGPDYLVMEFVEGSALRPVNAARKLLDTAVQIADGLSAAHAAGIVHRDLKPDNILVTREGRVKILDFGLAKSAVAAAVDGATQTMGITDPGTTVGTVNYMSPEQARGEANLTPQSDQFSLGLVLYELASGKRAFRRGSAAETMTAIIREEPEPLPVDVPAPFRWVVERLLSKEPAERYDSTRDVYRELKQVRERFSQTSGVADVLKAPVAKRPKRVLVAALVAVAVIAATLAAGYVASAPAPDFSAYKFTPLAPRRINERDSVWSPDGRSIAYTAVVHGMRQVFARSIGSPDDAQVTTANDNCWHLFWSPDGQLIYYSSGGNLWSVPAAGGTAHLILKNADAASIHPDGKTLAFVRDGKVWLSSLQGGSMKEFWPGPIDRVWDVTLSRFSPDGSALAVLADGVLWILPYPSGKPRKLQSTNRSAYGVAWFPDSRSVLTAEPGPLDTGSLVRINATDGSRQTIYTSMSSLFQPSVSPDGERIAFSSGAVEWDVVEVAFSNGAVRTLVGGAVGENWYPDWAPSGTHFLFTAGSATGWGIIDRDASDGGFSRRLADGVDAHWSPDGAHFVYMAGNGLLTLATASGGRAVLLDLGSSAWGGAAWSPDGQWICYLYGERGAFHLAKIRATPGTTPVPLADAAPYGRETPQWSPAGDWILYPVDGGLNLISPDGKLKRTLTKRRLLACNFSKDGSQVYGIFRNTKGEGAEWQLYAVNVKTAEEKLLAPVDFPPETALLAGFSIHPDGKRALTSISKWPFQIWMLEGVEQPPKNWFARLLGR